jgi:class 3 adenylate cyclase
MAAHHPYIVKRTGDGSLIEFRSVVDSARCAIEVQNGVAERNAASLEGRPIEFRVRVHFGEGAEEESRDLIAAARVAAR